MHIGFSRFTSTTALIMAALALTSGTALAHHNPGHGGGPGGGGDGGGEDPPTTVDVGWIYSQGDTFPDRATFRTDPDSGATTQVAGAPVDYGCDLPECEEGSGAIGVPSHDTHDGDRWYVAWRYPSTDIIFPGVQGPYHQISLEIDVVREGDATGVALTDNRNSCVYASGFWPGWTTDGSGVPDTAVTWLGAQWADLDGDPLGDCETFVKAGIFRADLQFDANGAVIGADAPVLEVEVPADANYNLSNIGGWSWSPDGSQVVYGEGSQVWVAGAGEALADRTMIVADTNTGAFDWSPDQDPDTAGLQTTIAFTGYETGGNRTGGLWTMAPDGSNLVRIANSRERRNSKQSSIVLLTPYWSPAGTHLAYVEFESFSLTENTETIRRVDPDGSNNVALATDEPGQDLRRLLAWTNVD